MIWNAVDESGDAPARVRLTLKANQAAHIDSLDDKSIELQCGDSSETLRIIESLVATDELSQQSAPDASTCISEVAAPQTQV